MFQQTIRLYQQAYRGLSPSIWLLAGVMLINRCGTMVLPFMMLYLTQHLHYSVPEAGMVMMVYGAGAFVGTFLGGRLTDRFGFYYIQLVSLLFGGLALLGLQFVTNFYGLCSSVFVFTLLGDSFRPANQAAIAHYATPETRTRGFSLNRLAINLGWAVGGGLGGWLANIDYRLLFWTDGLTCLAAGIVLGICLPVPPAQSLKTALTTAGNPVATEEASPQSPYGDKLFIGFVACSTLFFIAFMQLFSTVPLYFKEVLGLSERQIGGFMALNGILIVLVEMALVYSLEQQKKPKIKLIIWGVCLLALSYCTLTLRVGAPLSGFHIALLFLLVNTFSEMLSIPFLQSFTVERAPTATRGQYLALYSMGSALAQTSAPAFGSLMITYVGFSAHWLTLAGIGILAATGLWFIQKQLTTQQVTV